MQKRKPVNEIDPCARRLRAKAEQVQHNEPATVETSYFDG
jgi:hypothetical protein